MRFLNWLFASAILLAAGSVRAEERLPEGAEILGRGPIHEAFAQPLGTEKPEGPPTVDKQPPDPIQEIPPEQKPEGNSAWVPGYWQWDEGKEDFLWVSGVWRVAPPDRKWVPGFWKHSDDGWQWISGSWAPGTMTAAEDRP